MHIFYDVRLNVRLQQIHLSLTSSKYITFPLTHKCFDIFIRYCNGKVLNQDVCSFQDDTIDILQVLPSLYVFLKLDYNLGSWLYLCLENQFSRGLFVVFFEYLLGWEIEFRSQLGNGRTIHNQDNKLRVIKTWYYVGCLKSFDNAHVLWQSVHFFK